MRNGPIKNHRLISESKEEVRFRYRISSKEGGDGKRQTETSLPVMTFLYRWLQHVPPKGLQMIRGYGLYAGNQHSQLKAAQEALGLTDDRTADRTVSNWQEVYEAAGFAEYTRCPKCGRRLLAHSEFAPGRSPPRWYLEWNRNAA